MTVEEDGFIRVFIVGIIPVPIRVSCVHGPVYAEGACCNRLYRDHATRIVVRGKGEADVTAGH